jgi:eRF1 domain 1
MKVLKNAIDKRDGSGSVTLLPEEPEDMVFVSIRKM